MNRTPSLALVGLVAVLTVSCSGSDSSRDAGPDALADVAEDPGPGDPGEPPADPGTDTVEPDAAPGGPGSCRFLEPATDVRMCMHYENGWTRDEARADCEAVQPGIVGTWDPLPCPDDEVLGTCRLPAGDQALREWIATGRDPTRCNPLRTLCLLSASGTFQAGPLCQALGGPMAAWGSVPFVQPYRLCVPARDGEAPGQTDGKVCTWTLISGCTEDGRRFQDYGYCPDVITQRPYSPRAATTTASGDPRLQDEAYMAEVNWMARQVDACGCTCCHKAEVAPRGPAGWHIDAPGIWLDGLPDSGLALFAAFADSRALGAFPPEANNGFDRTNVGIPSTDVTRMKVFLEAEMVRRGLSEEDARKVPPFGGPLVEQFTFVPEPCDGGEGVAADGTIYWGDVGVRYLYILEPDAQGPVVPPNLDLPEGTIWRIEVSNVSPAFETATYGEVSGDQVQVFPTTGSPRALESGSPYYLYALIDVGFPVTRCLFTAP